MKKLLSLLSVLTISGIAVPTTIAASPYQKEECKRTHKIVVSDINNNVFAGGVLNNKLYFGASDNNLYEYDPATGKYKVVATVNGNVYPGQALNNKLYFGSSDDNLYEYDPITRKHKAIFNDINRNIYGATAINNKLYFGSTDYNLYEYDPATGKYKVVATVDGYVYPGGVINNKLYFGSGDNNLYEYDLITKKHNVVISELHRDIYPGGVMNNKLYFGSTDYNLYEYDPATGKYKVVATVDGYVYPGGVINNKLYFGSTDNNLYEYCEKYDNQWEPISSNGNELKSDSNYVYALFKPSLWEEIIIEWYNSTDANNFKLRFKNKINEYYYEKNDFSYWSNNVSYWYLNRLSSFIYSNWDKIISEWRNSSKLERIEIIVHDDTNEWHVKIKTEDMAAYINKFLNKQLLPEIITNTTLGDILIKGDTKDEIAILQAIKKHNPNVDTSQIYVGINQGEKTSTSAKIIVKEFSDKYSFKNRNWVTVYFNLKYE